MALDFASGLAGLAGGLVGLHNADKLPAFSGFTLSRGKDVQDRWFQALDAIRSATDQVTGQVDPVLLSSFSDLLGIDLSGLVNAGFAAGDQYANLAGTANQFGGMAAQQAQSLNESAFDPRSQLHDYMQNQVMDASRAGTSARGLGMSPYAAGMENDAVRKFNMDWQNEQLARQMAGSNAAQVAAANSLGYFSAAPGFQMQSASVPIQAQELAYGRPMDYATSFAQNYTNANLAPNMAAMGQMTPYLGGAAQNAAQAYGFDFNRANLKNQMQQQSMYGIAGGGQSGTPYMQGNQSGFGNPMNWMGIGSMGM